MQLNGNPALAPRINGMGWDLKGGQLSWLV
jgi:hypothetical protein